MNLFWKIENIDHLRKLFTIATPWRLVRIRNAVMPSKTTLLDRDCNKDLINQWNKSNWSQVQNMLQSIHRTGAIRQDWIINQRHMPRHLICYSYVEYIVSARCFGSERAVAEYITQSLYLIYTFEICYIKTMLMQIILSLADRRKDHAHRITITFFCNYGLNRAFLTLNTFQRDIWFSPIRKQTVFLRRPVNNEICLTSCHMNG